jgi:hypothetical protein
MSEPVENLVRRLNAKRSGNGWIAPCPAHEDRSPSLNISEGADGRVLLKCHAGCNTKDVIAALGLTLRDLFVKTTGHQCVSGNIRTSPVLRPVFDWQECVDAFTDENIDRIAMWRGYSSEFVSELRDNGQIGIYNGRVSFPVRDDGKIVGAHVLLDSGNWIYVPGGIKSVPFVFGELRPNDRVEVFESTWDGLDYMDKSGDRDSVIISRGTSNAKKSAALIPDGATAYVWTQNDKPGADWERSICANTKAAVKRVKIPTQHKDLNDWTRAGATVDDLIRALASAEVLRETEALPAIEDAAKLLSEPVILPPDVIEGVVHRGAKLVLGGASKSFKTWLLIDLAVSVATGNAWFNGYETRKGAVLYLNLELPAPFFTKRLATVCDERQLSIEPGMLSIWNLRGRALKWAEIQCQIRPDLYLLIILDPIYKLLLGRDENKAGDIASLMSEMELLAQRTGAAIGFGAHYSKGNQSQKESIDRIGGSGVFARDPDSILNFTTHAEENCFTVEASLRNHPPIKPFVVRWEYPLFVVASELNPTRLKLPGRPEQHRAKELLELIDEPISAGEIAKTAYAELGMPRRRVFELLAELKDAGLIRQPQKRGKYEPVGT